MGMFRFPIGVQLFNRPDYAEATLNSLYKQSLPIDTNYLHIFIDGFTGSSYEFNGADDRTQAVEEVARRIFPNAWINRLEVNLGIAGVHNRLQEETFSGLSPWSVFFEEDVVLDPLYLEELSNLIEIVDDCEQIVRVACFQVLPSLRGLPRGVSGFYPGLGTKAFAERRSFFTEKQLITATFLKLAAKNLDSPHQFINAQNSAELALRGHFLPYFQHDSLVESFLNSCEKLHVVTKPYLAKDIGTKGMNNFTVPTIKNHPTNSELEKSISKRKNELMQQLDQISSESKHHLKAQYIEMFERFHVLSSRKAVVKRFFHELIKPKNSKRKDVTKKF
jgi:hypothetical protein